MGPPLAQADSDALLAKLKRFGQPGDRVKVADGNTWRILVGHFEKAEDAEAFLQKLSESGYDELWISTESRPGQPRKGRALYAVTERYERRPLPSEGVRLVPAGETTLVVGKGRYRGAIEIFPNAQGRLTVMNTVELETYLRGVVPKEMGAWEYPALEALKAQAVAARTYAVANRGKREKEGFDLVDTVSDQVYGGRDGEQALTDRAIGETRGLVATFGGRPIQALFMADSGGHTVDNHYVFGDGFPYLKSASNYVEAPQTLAYQGAVAPKGDQGWVSWDLLRLAAADLVPRELLDGDRLAQPLAAADLRQAMAGLARRLGCPAPKPALEQGARLYLWMARSLGFDQVVEGMEKPQDAAYFLGETDLASTDLLLAGFLARRGLLPPNAWKGQAPTLGQGLQFLAGCGRSWNPWTWAKAPCCGTARRG